MLKLMLNGSSVNSDSYVSTFRKTPNKAFLIKSDLKITDNARPHNSLQTRLANTTHA